VNELEESPANDPYLGAATTFWNSVKDFKARMLSDDLPLQEVRSVTREPMIDSDGITTARPIHRAIPPEIFEFVALAVKSGAVAAGMTTFYKLVKLWSEHKRGRKFKVKFMNVEVELQGFRRLNFLTS
jgi:hypothetical protein